jgi:phosphohistidine phosphatase
MRLYLIRHAEAVPRRPGLKEEARALTQKGERQFRAVGKGLRNSGVRFDQLYFSPWLRAAATAEFLTPLVHGNAQSTLLLAQSPTEGLLSLLTGDCVGVVGHQPWLGELLGWLVLEDLEAGSRFEFDKGGVAILTGRPRPGAMTLCELLGADTLTRLNT